MHLHIALYPYDGSTEDGLVLVPGDEIDVTVDDIGDGWSQGKNLTTGKTDSSLPIYSIYVVRMIFFFLVGEV